MKYEITHIPEKEKLEKIIKFHWGGWYRLPKRYKKAFRILMNNENFETIDENTLIDLDILGIINMKLNRRRE